MSRRRAAVITVAILVVVAALTLGQLIKLPYAILSPGPAYNVMGPVTDEQGRIVPVIRVDGMSTYGNTTGALDFTTVRVAGGPGYPVSVIDVVLAWISPSSDVYPVEDFFPKEETEEQVREEGAAMMADSQSIAAGLAFEAARQPVVVLVDGVASKGPSNGVLESGDILLAIGGRPVTGTKNAIASVRAGTIGQPLPIAIRRHDKDLTVTVTPAANAAGQSAIGVGLTPQPSHDVHFSVGEIGGPSAGLMFGLGIYDLLTPGPATGSARIAGTGAVAANGEIIAIGGIKQKMIGAARAGATFFLAPADNCDEVVGNVPDGMQVVRVETFDDALADVKAIAADQLDRLPACTVR